MLSPFPTDAELETMILSHEGSDYTNHPNDRGGPTRWGITIPVLTAARGRAVTAEDIKNLTRDEAAMIYNALFIRPFKSLGNTLFRANVTDMGVNAGVVRATKLMQQTVGADVDGKMGPQTLSLATRRNWNSIYIGVRVAFYERLVGADQSQRLFRSGWRNRALSFDIYTAASAPRTLSVGGPTFGFTGKAIYDE